MISGPFIGLEKCLNCISHDNKTFILIVREGIKLYRLINREDSCMKVWKGKELPDLDYAEIEKDLK